MTAGRRPRAFDTAVVVAAVVGAWTVGARQPAAAPSAPRVGADAAEVVRGVGFEVRPVAGTGAFVVTSPDATTRVVLEASVLVGGLARPLALRGDDARATGDGGLEGSADVSLGDTGVRARVALRPVATTLGDGVELVVELPQTTGAALDAALRVDVETPASLFVASRGRPNEPGLELAPALVVDDGRHPVALASTRDPLSVGLVAGAAPGAPRRARVETTRAPVGQARAAGPRPPPARLAVTLLVGSAPESIFGPLARALGRPTARVRGQVTGAVAGTDLVAVDDEGREQVRFALPAHGGFVVEAPVDAVSWLAVAPNGLSSAPVRFPPGTPWDLRLDVAPAGELHARVVDHDTGQPLVARLVVRGVDGTLDPSFGPDYRASGAGPLADLARGEVVTPLPRGRYRVLATHGPEWSVDAEPVEVRSGERAEVELRLRHVVPQPERLGCDLHVHARPSFDTPVSTEDRVLSLVAAGVDFAVPTEHNLVGDYGPALEAQRLSGKLQWVPGVEVTTFAPRLGHFGVFPYDAPKPPPYRGTSMPQLFAHVRKDPTRLFQANHPRLPKGIGYFGIFGWDPRAEPPKRMPVGFDLLEVYNGFDGEHPARVDEVMRDWFALLARGQRIVGTGSSDAHRIQYQWAGWPRTYAFAPSRTEAQVLASLRAGRAFVTSGPMIELEVDGRGPGDDVHVTGGEVRVRLRVRAAPWIDVRKVEIVVGGDVALRLDVPEVPLSFEMPEGALGPVREATLRFDRTLAVTLPPKPTWLLAIVRGERRLDEALPFMPWPPLAFTNPVWLSP